MCQQAFRNTWWYAVIVKCSLHWYAEPFSSAVQYIFQPPKVKNTNHVGPPHHSVRCACQSRVVHAPSKLRRHVQGDTKRVCFFSGVRVMAYESCTSRSAPVSCLLCPSFLPPVFSCFAQDKMGGGNMQQYKCTSPSSCHSVCKFRPLVFVTNPV